MGHLFTGPPGPARAVPHVGAVACAAGCPVSLPRSTSEHCRRPWSSQQAARKAGARRPPTLAAAAAGEVGCRLYDRCWRPAGLPYSPCWHAHKPPLVCSLQGPTAQQSPPVEPEPEPERQQQAPASAEELPLLLAGVRVVLVSPKTPGNIGAVLRVAENFEVGCWGCWGCSCHGLPACPPACLAALAALFGLPSCQPYCCCILLLLINYPPLPLGLAAACRLTMWWWLTHAVMHAVLRWRSPPAPALCCTACASCPPWQTPFRTAQASGSWQLSRRCWQPCARMCMSAS